MGKGRCVNASNRCMDERSWPSFPSNLITVPGGEQKVPTPHWLDKCPQTNLGLVTLSPCPLFFHTYTILSFDFTMCIEVWRIVLIKQIFTLLLEPTTARVSESGKIYDTFQAYIDLNFMVAEIVILDCY